MTLEIAVSNSSSDAVAANSGRDYQIDAVRKLWHALVHEERKRVLLQLATGGGKTRVANDFVAKWIKYNVN